MFKHLSLFFFFYCVYFNLQNSSCLFVCVVLCCVVSKKYPINVPSWKLEDSQRETCVAHRF